MKLCKSNSISSHVHVLFGIKDTSSSTESSIASQLWISISCSWSWFKRHLVFLSAWSVGKLLKTCCKYEERYTSARWKLDKTAQAGACKWLHERGSFSLAYSKIPLPNFLKLVVRLLYFCKFSLTLSPLTFFFGWLQTEPARDSGR